MVNTPSSPSLRLLQEARPTLQEDLPPNFHQPPDIPLPSGRLGRNTALKSRGEAKKTGRGESKKTGRGKAKKTGREVGKRSTRDEEWEKWRALEEAWDPSRRPKSLAYLAQPVKKVEDNEVGDDSKVGFLALNGSDDDWTET